MDHTKLSKQLSYILRHHPEHIGISLDQNGWVSVATLLTQMNAYNYPVTPGLLEEIVATNSKKRFAFNNDKTMIRASQGHSVDIDLDLKPVTPPEILYHGTAEKHRDSILSAGLKKQNRRHVHLSDNTETARNVGSRHGKPLIFLVNAAQMHADGYSFFVSENNVWLTEEVPPIYLRTAPDPDAGR